jgi:hypothetical protein
MVFMMPCWIAAEFLVDGHAEGKGARADKEQEAGPRRHYSIIRGTLWWTHSTLTYLPSGTGCLAASRIPYWRHIKRNSVRSGASAIFLQSVVPIEQSKTSALSIFFHHASSHSFQKIAHKFHISDASTRVAGLNASLILSSVGSDRRRSWAGCSKIDGLVLDRRLFCTSLSVRISAQGVRLASAHGVQPSQLNRLTNLRWR